MVRKTARAWPPLGPGRLRRWSRWSLVLFEIRLARGARVPRAEHLVHQAPGAGVRSWVAVVSHVPLGVPRARPPSGHPRSHLCTRAMKLHACSAKPHHTGAPARSRHSCNQPWPGRDRRRVTPEPTQPLLASSGSATSSAATTRVGAYTHKGGSLGESSRRAHHRVGWPTWAPPIVTLTAARGEAHPSRMSAQPTAGGGESTS